MNRQNTQTPSWIQRYVLPGLAFKAVVIGGGYATGRELAEFFLPSGPLGGLLGMLVATAIWSLVCALTFSLAFSGQLLDYRAFFGNLLGRAWILFEIIYVLLVLLILSVFGAASGAIGHALFGWPTLTGTVLLLGSIAVFVAIGAGAVEPLFKYVSVLLYITYAVFLALSIWKFGPQIRASLTHAKLDGRWLAGGFAYAGYNSVAAVVILPVLRHLTSRREAVAAGILAGPLAMIPGFFFFLAMAAWYPGIDRVALPSDYLLLRIGIPAVRLLFQVMIFFALLESGSGAVHAIMQRVLRALGRQDAETNTAMKAALTFLVLAVCVLAAQRFGLVELIAKGYRFMSWAMFAIFIVPLTVRSLLWACKGRRQRTGPIQPRS